MSATPQGLLSVPASLLQNLIANSTNWQTWCNVASAAAALPFVHLFTFPNASLSFPFALIWMDKFHRVATSASAAAEFVYQSESPELRLVIEALTGTIVTITQTGGVATVTWPNHSIATNEYIEVSGADQAGYNTTNTGPVKATYINANQFSYTVPAGTASPATGTIYCQPADDTDLTVRFMNRLGAVLDDMQNTPGYLRFHELELIHLHRADVAEAAQHGDFFHAEFRIVHEGIA